MTQEKKGWQEAANREKLLVVKKKKILKIIR